MWPVSKITPGCAMQRQENWTVFVSLSIWPWLRAFDIASVWACGGTMVKAPILEPFTHPILSRVIWSRFCRWKWWGNCILSHFILSLSMWSFNNVIHAAICSGNCVLCTHVLYVLSPIVCWVLSHTIHVCTCTCTCWYVCVCGNLSISYTCRYSPCAPHVSI